MREIQGRKAPSTLLFITPLPLLLEAPPLVQRHHCVSRGSLSPVPFTEFVLGEMRSLENKIECLETVVCLYVERLEDAAGMPLGS